MYKETFVTNNQQEIAMLSIYKIIYLASLGSFLIRLIRSMDGPNVFT